MRARRARASAKGHAGAKWGYYYFLILLDANVQRELALTRTQLDKCEILKGEFLDHVARRAGAQGDTKPARKNGAAAKGEKAEPTDSAGPLSDKALAFLTDRQRIRLGQVIFQLRKMEIFYYPEVAKFLELTAEQTKEAAAIRRWTADEAKKLRTLFLQKRKTSREVQKGVVSLLEKGRARFVKAFSPEQLRKLESLQGKEISFDQTDLNFVVRRSNRTRAATGADRGEGCAR